MLKQITLHDGRIVKMGRRRPVAHGPRLHFKNYIDKAHLPEVPKTFSYAPKARSALAQMYNNDVWGDCVIAEIAHAEGVWTGNNGVDQAVIFSAHRIYMLYHAIGGYQWDQPDTDHGCDEETALNYWMRHGAMPDQKDPHRIAGYVAVNGHDPEEVRLAVFLFECLMTGEEMPDAWVADSMSSFKPGSTLDVAGAPNPENGHCMGIVGGEPGRVQMSTYGMDDIWQTDAAIAAYCTGPTGQLFAPLSPNAVNRATGKAPNGIAWQQLINDLKAHW
jgi:hypothetical protein